MNTAPLLRQLATGEPSAAAMASLNATTPFVVARPAKSTLIFSVTGTPCSAPSGAPCLTDASLRSASASASSARRSTTALSRGLTASILFKAACTASREDALRSRMRRASSVAPHCQSSMRRMVYERRRALALDRVHAAGHCGVDDERRRAEERQQPQPAAPERGEHEEAGARERLDLCGFHAEPIAIRGPAA